MANAQPPKAPPVAAAPAPVMPKPAPVEPEAQKPEPAPPRFVGDRPREEKIALEWPLEYDGQVYSEVVLRRMSVADSIKLADAKQDGETGADVIARSLGVPLAVVEALDVDDFERIQEALERFFPKKWREAVAEARKQAEATLLADASPKPPSS
jgi:hypothetical protein